MKMRFKVSLKQKQIQSFLVAIIKHAQSTQSNKSLQYFCNISRKKEGMKLIFCMQINKPFSKLILSILVSITSLAQSTRSNKFSKFLQYLKKEVRDKVDSCRDKLQSIQKVDTAISDGCSQACLKYLK